MRRGKKMGESGGRGGIEVGMEQDEWPNQH